MSDQVILSESPRLFELLPDTISLPQYRVDCHGADTLIIDEYTGDARWIATEELDRIIGLHLDDMRPRSEWDA